MKQVNILIFIYYFKFAFTQFKKEGQTNKHFAINSFVVNCHYDKISKRSTPHADANIRIESTIL